MSDHNPTANPATGAHVMTDTHTTAHIPDEAVQAAMSKVLLTKAEALDALTAAIPYLFNAGTKPVDVAALAQDLLVAWDQQYSCMKRDDAAKALSDKLLLAACFAGIAYDAAMSLPIMVDKAPEFLLRIFLIALVDQNSSELDPYRAKNRPLPATLTNEGTKPVDVAAGREVPVSIDKLISELKSAEDMCFSWAGSALLANELNAADTDEEHISLYKDLCGLGNAMSYLQSAIRALSPAEPAPYETAAMRDVMAERKRQIEIKGFDASHDEMNSRGQLVTAAGCYVLHSSHLGDELEIIWPWDLSWWKPTSRRRDLVKAGALILAEIERLDRAAPTPEAGKSS